MQFNIVEQSIVSRSGSEADQTLKCYQRQLEPYESMQTLSWDTVNARCRWLNRPPQQVSTLRECWSPPELQLVKNLTAIDHTTLSIPAIRHNDPNIADVERMIPLTEEKGASSGRKWIHLRIKGKLNCPTVKSEGNKYLFLSNPPIFASRNFSMTTDTLSGHLPLTRHLPHAFSKGYSCL